jgi:plasmid stabilization system protein ParE
LDIAEEVDYLASKAGSETAEAWHSALNQTIRQLQRHPHIGRQRTDLNPPDLRSWRVNHFRRWLIFYTVRKDALVLLRVRYGMMDFSLLEFES